MESSLLLSGIKAADIMRLNKQSFADDDDSIFAEIAWL